jgi:hypothetical protein
MGPLIVLDRDDKSRAGQSGQYLLAVCPTPVRECTTSSTLVPLSLTTPSSLLSAPGRSGMASLAAGKRPAQAAGNHAGQNQRVDNAARQHRAHRDRRPSSGADVMSTATAAAAPSGSTISFAAPCTAAACDSASSLTVRTESANARTWANGTPPGTATAMPSAIVDINAAHTGFPAAKEPGQPVASGLHFDHSHLRRQKVTAAAIPAISPPPPVGTSMWRHRESASGSRAQRGLAGDDVGVVEREDQHCAVLLGEFTRLNQRVDDRLADQMNSPPTKPTACRHTGIVTREQRSKRANYCVGTRRIAAVQNQLQNWREPSMPARQTAWLRRSDEGWLTAVETPAGSANGRSRLTKQLSAPDALSAL